MDNEKTLYHYYRKDSSYVRDALFKAYGGKCFYCSISLEPRHMHVDHILPTKRSGISDEEVKRYIQELEDKGFIQDSIENYVPSCSSCNIKKSNQIFNATNLRFFHEQARKHVNKILSGIEQARKGQEYFYEPANPSIWEELTFSYQRDISHAIMGYRLTSQDVNSCPVFPQVNKTEKLLTAVDHVIIQRERAPRGRAGTATTPPTNFSYMKACQCPSSLGNLSRLGTNPDISNLYTTKNRKATHL